MKDIIASLIAVGIISLYGFLDCHLGIRRTNSQWQKYAQRESLPMDAYDTIRISQREYHKWRPIYARVSAAAFIFAFLLCAFL